MMSLVTEFQVSAVAFSILMDYFSSVPVTKKNLVTEQTQLLVISMTFCVCTQVTRNFVCLLAPHRVTLIVALPLILTSLKIISYQISSVFLKFPLKFSVSSNLGCQDGTLM